MKGSRNHPQITQIKKLENGLGPEAAASVETARKHSVLHLCNLRNLWTLLSVYA